MLRRRGGYLSLAAVAGVLVSLLAPVSVAVAAGPDYSRKWSPSNTALPTTTSVRGKNVDNTPVTAPSHPVPPTWQPPKTTRPAPQGHADVHLGTVAAATQGRSAGQSPQAGPEAGATGLPLSLAPLAGSSVVDQVVKVDLVDPRAATAAGIPGPVLKFSRDGSHAAGQVRLSLDTGTLAESYGANWAARAQLVSLPACSLTTPDIAGCLQQAPVPSHYDAAAKKLVADVTLPGDDGTATTRIQSLNAAPAAAPASAQPVVLAAVAGSTSGAGTYSATPLNISQAWSAGSSSGAFTYSSPIQVPPSFGSQAPAVALSYDSSSVDGKTSSTNAQASWIGDGWDYNPGFIERRYQPCSKDGITGSGDQCWAGANLTLALTGHSGELVPDDASCQAGAAATMEQSACTWRIKGDDGSKVQFLTGATNGTWNGSYIKVTETAGTVLYFGLAHLPDASGNPSTKGPDSGSAWTVPVYSPNSGDPCYDPAKGKASWCQSAWRWNLDYVVDPHGNLTTYTYTPEANFYARGGGQNSGTGANSSYTRGGVLASIGYGQLLSDQITANGTYNPAAKIDFVSDERCVTSVAACNPANRTQANAGNWPDVPIDQQCGQSGTCTNYGPTYWTSKWLASITTKVRNNGAYQDVDAYALTHRFVNVVNTTESTQVPWLASVQRTGKDKQASDSPAPLPPVSFTEMLLRNRVDGTNLVPSRPDYNRPRIQLITTETGSTIGVDYYPADCSRVSNTMPASADSNTRSCYNVKWHVPNEQSGADPVDDWFLRYPVKTVTLNPNTPGATAMTTAYSYGNAAWHRNDSPFTDTKDRTWDDFRGYANVTTTAGSGSDGPKSQKSVTYHQGMDGDITASGAARIAKVAGPMSAQVTDSDWLNGQALETDTYDKAGGTITAYAVSTSSGPVPTATHSRTGLPALLARYGSTSSVSTAKSLKADGSWRTTTKTATTDPAHNNRPLTALSSADALPDICQRTTYAAGPDSQVSALVAEQVSVSGANACTADLTEQNTSSWTRAYYDGKPLNQAGTKTEPTSRESLDRFNGTTPVFTVDSTFGYDTYGRVLTITDPKVTDNAHSSGAVVTTSYSAPQPGELPTSVTVNYPAPAGASDQATGRSTVTALNSARSLPKSNTDSNNRVTTLSYDALGRTTGVWLPGRATGLSPNTAYTYAVPGVVAGKVVPPSTTTTALVGVGSGTTYSSVSSTQIMDGLGRVIQTQSAPAVRAYNTGRILADTAYDSLGRVIRSNGNWYNDAAPPGTTLYQTTTAEAPNHTHTVYDGLGRPTTTEFVAYGVVQSTTTTAYPGVDRTDVSPPTGSTPTSTVTDARGLTTALWQYKTATATGNPGDADVTTYTYDLAGKPATRKDAAANTWSYAYDVRGRQTSATDPDTGTSTIRYDGAGRVASTTDARGRSITSTYDLLGRTTATYDGLAADAAKQLTARTYDTVLKGQPSSSTRYVGGTAGAAYTSAVLAYDTAYHPTKTTLTIPGSEIGSSTPFTYTYQAGYEPVTGLLTLDNRSAVGNIAAETVNYNYETWGLLKSFGAFGGSTYDLSNDYDAYGRPVRTTVNPWGTQIVVTNSYDESTGRPLSQFVDKQTAGTGAVQQTTYAYDASGRITALRNIPDNDPSKTDLQCFSYDHLSRLTTAWSDTGQLTMAPQPAVGGRGACANTTPTSGAVAPATNTVGGGAPYWQDYTYDLTGNRKTLTQHNPTGGNAQDALTTQTFTAPGTVNNGNGSGGPHALTTQTTVVNGNTTAYATNTYDQAGNTTAQYTYAAGTTDLNWNTEGKLDTYRPPVQIQGIGGKCLALQGGSSANNTPAEITNCDATSAQKFATGGNKLKVYGSCLTAMGTTAGSAIQLQTCNGTTAQTWTTRTDGSIANPTANLCLAVPGNVTTNGTDVTLAACGTPVPTGQKWTVPDQSTTYVYDADGNQLIRHNPGKTTITLGGDELTYDTTTNPATTTGTRYYQMPGGLTLVRQGTTATWQINDHHGTGNLALDATTLTETRRPTDPFGNPRGAQPTGWAGTHGYVGGTKDDATGLTNLGARQYQPTTGRFINPDPILNPADPQQWNGYAYSNNNPINLSDPSGLLLNCGGDRADCPTDGHAGGDAPGGSTDSGGSIDDTDGTTTVVPGVEVDNNWSGKYEFVDRFYKDWARWERSPHAWDFTVGPEHTKAATAALLTLKVFNLCMELHCPKDMFSVFGAISAGSYFAGDNDLRATLNSLVPHKLSTASKQHSLGAACKNSFPPGTLVLKSDGSTIPIEELTVGDEVLATDPDTHSTQGETVTATILTPDDQDFTDLTLAVTDEHQSAAESFSTITSTQHHPYWEVTKKHWTDAVDLNPGDEVLAADGTTVKIIDTRSYRTGPRTAYNLTVEHLHTYYVLAGATPVLVHNCERAGLDFTDAERQKVYDANAAKNGGEYRCDYCGQKVERRASRDADGNPVKGLPDDAQIDHIEPRASGGHGGDHNGAVACRRCNRDKSTKTLEDWDDELREFLEP